MQGKEKETLFWFYFACPLGAKNTEIKLVYDYFIRDFFTGVFVLSVIFTPGPGGQTNLTPRTRINVLTAFQLDQGPPLVPRGYDAPATLSDA